MASEHVLGVLVRRHVIKSDRPFSSVLDGIFGGISQPDMVSPFSERVIRAVRPARAAGAGKRG